MAEQIKQQHGFIVLVEWDGRKPPTSWYSYLEQYGLTTKRGARYNEERQSPLSRRLTGDNPYGLAFQEGAIVVNSGDLARKVASTARYYGATTISIGSISVNPFTMSEQDEAALAKVMAVTSKRGPKAKSEEGRYSIFCIEEAVTHITDLRERPVCCPNCGSSRITWHRAEQGKIVKTFDPSSDDLLKYWVATRFDKNGIFETPSKTRANAELPELPDVDTFEQGIKNQINLTTEFAHDNAEIIDGDGLEILRAMDVAYCVQSISDEERLSKRIAALREFYAGGRNTVYPMAINPLHVDLVDVAAMDARFISKL